MDDAFILSKPVTATREREPLRILQGGAGRGALKNLAAIERFNRRSTRYRIEPTYADPSPGRTDALLGEARRRGVPAFGVEARVEEVALERAGAHAAAPVVLQIDRGADIARTLAALAGTDRAVFVYLLAKRAGGELAGIRMYLGAGRADERRLAAAFFARLGEVTLPNGAAALFGEGAAAEDLGREPLFRAWFAEHLTSNLPKAVARLAPECAPFEITTDGRSTLTLHLVERDAFADPIDLAEGLVRSPSSPIEKGRDFMIGEFTPGGVRFATVRLRKTDGRLALQGAVILDEAAREEGRRLLDARVRERATPGSTSSTGGDPRTATAVATLADVLAAAAANTLTATNPVRTTD